MSENGAPTSSDPFVREDTSICSHLRAIIEGGDHTGPITARSLRDSEIGRRYSQVVRWGAVDEGVKKRKISLPQCDTCHTSLARPWACLTCPVLGCLTLSPSSSSAKDCLRDHWRGSGDACSFGIDTTTGAIFCHECDDTIYSDAFEDLFSLTKIRTEEAVDKSREAGSGIRAKGRGAWQEWEVSPEQRLKAIGQVVKSSCRGIRPLLNLSQTCFLSAILQALISNPLLKAYFLGEKHNRHVCTNNSRNLLTGRPDLGPDFASSGAVGPERDRGCMCCEMDRAFEEFYNDECTPFGPVTMLYVMWHASAELEGYGQQDAHSFFLAALDQMHANAKGQMSSCNCIAHQTFAGSLTSTVTCSNCQEPSITVDPILDIQLDFPLDAPLDQSLTLNQLLRRFCAEERVGDYGGKGYDCASCGGGQGVSAKRKLMLKKLPPVLALQLKRFRHDSSSSKIETPIRFPSKLDMRPYTEDPGTSLPDSLYLYDLFAVVTHEGKLDNGHYWADVLSTGEWWHCDDDKVTPTTLGAVLRQKAYMLFYVKRSLAYLQPAMKTANGVGAGAGATNGEAGH